MYERPRLERYGTFRELTAAAGGSGGNAGNSAKRLGVNDVASVLNSMNSNSPNVGCNPMAQPHSAAGCAS